MTDEPSPQPTSGASDLTSRRAAAQAGRKTLLVSILLFTGAAVLMVADGSIEAAALLDRPMFAWWAIALLSLVAELLPVHVDIRRETYTFTLSEVPMVVGLFFADPLDLLVGRLVGELVVLALKERQHPRKILLNLATCAAGSAVLVSTYRLLGQPVDVERPATWGLVVLSVAAAGTLGYVVVATVIRWHGGPASIRTLTASGLLTLPVNTALGLAVAVMLVESPWATLLLTSVALFLVASYYNYGQLAERHASLSLLHDFTIIVGGARSPDAVLEAILEHAKRLLVAERAEIWLVDDDNIVGLEVSHDGRHSVRVPPKAEELVRSWFPDTLDAIVVNAADRHHDPLIATALRARQCVVAPITEAGKVIGLIAAVDRVGGVAGFRPRDAKMFTTLAAHASAALANGRLIDRLHDEARSREHEALHDPLTGLPNRVLFARRLRDELDAADRGLAAGPVVGLMDLDGFKQINDSLGHHWGDHALVEVARRLTRTVGPAITVARLGGDEFSIVVPSLLGETLDAFAQRLHRSVTEPLLLGGQRVSLGISIGLAEYTGSGVDGAALMRRADAAMYRAKQNAKRGDGQGFALATLGDGLADA